MESIQVHKDELLAKLEQNRADHRRIFEEALEGFRQKVISLLEERVAEARAGNRLSSIRISMSMPEDHTSEYDRAIAMVKMSIGDTITLGEYDFAQFVMDDWGWQSQFLSNTYGSQTATGKFSDRYDVR